MERRLRSSPTIEVLKYLFTQNINMRQWRWLELIKVFNFYILDHSGKAKVVAKALSRKSQGEVASLMPALDQLAL